MKKLRPMLRHPGLGQTKRNGRKLANNSPAEDLDGNLVLAVERVQVGRLVCSVEHANDDAVEAREVAAAHATLCEHEVHGLLRRVASVIWGNRALFEVLDQQREERESVIISAALRRVEQRVQFTDGGAVRAMASHASSIPPLAAA